MSSTTPNLRLALTGVSGEDKNMLFETWRTQMSGEDATSNMQIIDAAISEDRERIAALEEKGGAVSTVNGQDGEVILDAEDVGARPNDWVPSISDIDGLQEAINNGGNVKTVNSVSADDNGNITLQAHQVGALSINKDGAVEGSSIPVNADTLGGIPASQYALKSDTTSGDSGSGEPGGSSVPCIPSGGAAGQVLAKSSNSDYETEWIDPPSSSIDPDDPIDADTLEGKTLEEIKTTILTDSEVNATKLDGMTFEQLKTAILAEVVYQ